MTAAPLHGGGAPSGALPAGSDEESRRFRLTCRMLRKSGALDVSLPNQRRGESIIDWLVRHKLAPNPKAAAEALLAARGLQQLRDELLADPDLKI